MPATRPIGFEHAGSELLVPRLRSRRPVHRSCALITDAAPTAPGRVDHVAVTYLGPADLLGTYERLTAATIEPYLAVNHGVSAAFYYRDPDGNQLELSCDNFASVDALNEWLATGDFDETGYHPPPLKAVPTYAGMRDDRISIIGGQVETRLTQQRFGRSHGRWW
jgi:hypothetical protein